MSAQDAIRAKRVEVEMPDGSLWHVPLEAVARHRAEHYADEFGGVEESLREDTVPLFLDDPSEAIDWAANNMDWADVAASAERIAPPPELDFQEGWVNGKKRVVDAGKGG